jgi:hypothetical protein
MVRLKSLITAVFAGVIVACSASANKITDEAQLKWLEKYANRAGTPKPEEILLNTSPEPSLEGDFISLYNGKDLSGWTPRGGTCTFEAKGDIIEGVCVPGSPSTYLSTDKDDYTDFIFTCEIKWEVDGNTGIQFRSQIKQDKKGETVAGPQVEVEDKARNRGWSGAIYAQSLTGAYYYPLCLDAHAEARKAINYDDWNRITIEAKGDTVKTWVNGIPATHWKTDDHLKGFFSLQVHSGKQGTIHFRHIRVKELK